MNVSDFEEEIILKKDEDEEIKYKCYFCVIMTFNNETELLLHMEEHHKTMKSLQCTICNCYFPLYCALPTEVFLLHRHWDLYHPNYPQLQGLLPSEFNIFRNTEEVSDYIAIEISPVKFDYFRNMKKEVEMILDKEETDKKLNNLNRNIRNLKTIKDRPTETVICNICNKSITSGYIKKHIQSVHEKKCIFKCKICEEKFLRAKQLAKHRRLAHGINNLKMCDLCGKEVTDMKKHHISKHSNQRDHVCHICGDAFKFISAVKSHVMRVHGTERKYRCKMCTKSFKTANCAREHLKKYHKMKDIPRDIDFEDNPIELLL